MNEANSLEVYSSILNDVKNRIRKAQIKATLSANTEMISMYFDIGKIIYDLQNKGTWGDAIIPKLSRDILNDLPEIKGFSERNINFMLQFFKEYNSESEIMKQPVSKLDEIKNLAVQIPWGHNIVLMQKIKDLNIRSWYIQETIVNGWSRDVLSLMIKSNLFERQGKSVTNFEKTLLPEQSDLVKQTLKDPYIFDFLTLRNNFDERELELGLIKHIEKFLIELGKGFAFVGRQYHLEIADKDFYLDLLFYHLKLRCFVVIDLKKGDFKPEYVGKMNFYCSAVDDLLKHSTDQPTIGLILCQTKDKIFAEYALRDINKPIGISEYELINSLPEDIKSSLPTIEEIEEELLKEKD
ncbi:MAG: PDDEXK nuclease domain-containing protein [Candidatus Sericytochromatia bacterium]